MSSTFEQAKEFFLQGLERYQTGCFAEAEANFAASLALLPGRASTLTNLGAARLKLGRPHDALELLEEALAQEPDNGEAWGHRATALAELGRAQEALDCVEHALRIAPTVGQAWSLRGSLLKDLGHRSEAALAFQNAIAHGADTQLNLYFLASLNAADPPACAPRAYVELLFDGYADQFDKHLVHALDYQAPRILIDRLQAMHPPRFARALDLGCGTGLCGQLVKPMTTALDGVDLSSNMLARARALGVYDELAHADLMQYVAGTRHRYDLVLAADVFIYVGALDAVFAATAQCLQAGGMFCFSVEAGDESQDYALRDSLRYAHSERYLRALAGRHGLDVAAMAHQPIRHDQRAPVPGIFAWLAKR